MKQKLKTLGVYSSMEERRTQSDPTPVVEDDDTESVASVKTRDVYPWNWNIEMPRIDLQVTIPGWLILLGAALFFRGPKAC